MLFLHSMVIPWQKWLITSALAAKHTKWSPCIEIFHNRYMKKNKLLCFASSWCRKRTTWLALNGSHHHRGWWTNQTPKYWLGENMDTRERWKERERGKVCVRWVSEWEVSSVTRWTRSLFQYLFICNNELCQIWI